MQGQGEASIHTHPIVITIVASALEVLQDSFKMGQAQEEAVCGCLGGVEHTVHSDGAPVQWGWNDGFPHFQLGKGGAAWGSTSAPPNPQRGRVRKSIQLLTSPPWCSR